MNQYIANPEPAKVVANYPGQTPATRRVRAWGGTTPLVTNEHGVLVPAASLPGYQNVTTTDA